MKCLRRYCSESSRRVRSRSCLKPGVPSLAKQLFSHATIDSAQHLAGMTVFVILAGAVGGWAGTTAALRCADRARADRCRFECQEGAAPHRRRGRRAARSRRRSRQGRRNRHAPRPDHDTCEPGDHHQRSRRALGAQGATLQANAMVRTRWSFPIRLRVGEASRTSHRSWTASASCSICAGPSRSGQKAQLRQQVEQLQEEIVGMTAQQRAKKREIELINRELEGVRDLFQKNLVQINRLTQLEREATRLDGEQAQLIAAVAQAKGKIAEIELKDNSDRPGSQQRSRQGDARDRCQDRRIHRAQDRGRRPAAARRYPRAAGRRPFSNSPSTPSEA